METAPTTTDGYTEAVKTGWRTLREAVFTLIHNDPSDWNERSQAEAVIEAVLPMMVLLTSRDRHSILNAVMRRLERDGRLPAERVRLLLVRG